MKLEDLKQGSIIQGILPDRKVSIIDVKWHGSNVIEVVYRDTEGKLGSELLYRECEPSINLVEQGRPWSFDGDGNLFRLVSEAYRIRLGYLFDPYLAVSTSMVDPLPHQISAVYQEMLDRQPLRFLLADDPGAGKTIMAGLLIKEMLIRGDLKRCLIVCPGNLVEQWQDELYQKFNLSFDIMTNDKVESSRTGNWFEENNLIICRLDKLSRDENIHVKIENTDWDLIICDEAHKMSASYYGGEIKYTARYRLGQLLSGITRNFLLMSATPHNGKEEDFQLFMALLDGDRFEGKYREGTHMIDASDMMRRMIKEQLVKFDGRPLFPERRAYTVNFALSGLEADLYRYVTNYVKEEFNRADALENDGRRGTIGFALTILQRRLASSPAAIYESLKRRREKMERRLKEEELLRRAAHFSTTMKVLSAEDEDDLSDAPDEEVENMEDEIIDQATAAQSIEELKAEIKQLLFLENFALQVRQSGKDKKWEELSSILQNNSEMFDIHGTRRKLVIFTEQRDTLNYLADKIRTLLGQQEAVVTISGGMLREERKKAQQLFTQDKDVFVLVATDAAGEGINLQRAHLMINYDLPWNPNRLEQRFGRIHRIGQEEVCHLWNLVAEETREGDVFLKLLKKLEAERASLGGKVFDVLGKVFEGSELRKLLIEAIRYGDKPEVRDKLNQIVEHALDHENLLKLIEDKALFTQAMDTSRVQKIKEDMERAEARRLQPHFIASFFLQAFEYLGGKAKEREKNRYEVSFVPAVIRNRDRQIGYREPVLTRYERITFEKQLREQEHTGKVNAKLNSDKAQKRADELQARLQKRMIELEQEMKLSPTPPVVIGGAIIVPIGLLQAMTESQNRKLPDYARETEVSERIAMQVVMAREFELGNEPRDVSMLKVGYDIESKDGTTGDLRFIEVKGRIKGANIITVTKNEILTALNKPEQFTLAVVLIDDNKHELFYVSRPFNHEPDFGVTSINYKVNELLANAERIK